MTQPHQFKHLLQQFEDGAVVLTVTVTHLRGDDLADALRAEMLDALAHSGTARVVVDLQQVESLSSVAFRPLLSLLKQVRSAGGRLVLCGLRPDVASVFHITRMISTSGSAAAPFEQAADVPAALAALKR
jgi:anti-anti-sigma factor